MDFDDLKLDQFFTSRAGFLRHGFHIIKLVHKCITSHIQVS